MKTLLTRTPKQFKRGLERRAVVRKEHERLKYFEGNWAHKTSIWLAPDSEPIQSNGKSKVASLHDGRHYVLQHSGRIIDDVFTSSSQMGFDNLREEYITFSTDSLSTGLFVAYGKYDSAKKTYTFYGEIPSLRNPGESIKVRLVRRIVDENHYTFEWHETHGRQEIKTMQSDFTRK